MKLSLVPLLTLNGLEQTLESQAEYEFLIFYLVDSSHNAIYYIFVNTEPKTTE